MNQRLVKVPFNVETARKITEGKIKGRVIDVVLNCPARILDFNFNSYVGKLNICLLYTSPSPRDISGSRMPSSA